MIDTLVYSFGETCRAIAQSFPHVVNNLFILNGKLNGYAQILIVTLSVSIVIWLFKVIHERITLCKKRKR